MTRAWLFLCSEGYGGCRLARGSNPTVALCTRPLHFALGSLTVARVSWEILGTASAEKQDGKHEEVKRAPAAITSLSAASRCASRPPSDPSV